MKTLLRLFSFGALAAGLCATSLQAVNSSGTTNNGVPYNQTWHITTAATTSISAVVSFTNYSPDYTFALSHTLDPNNNIALTVYTPAGGTSGYHTNSGSVSGKPAATYQLSHLVSPGSYGTVNYNLTTTFTW